ncbi:MAG: thiolase family protein [Sulfolobales archaeon]|nr:thiolase family protein [Sulfolobales archaeon]
MKVGIVGAYSVKYELRSEKEAWELIGEVVRGTLKSVDKGISSKDIDFVVVSNFSDRFGGILHTAPYVVSLVGNPSARGLRVENACASGGTALYVAWNLVRTGLAENVLVVGYEKMSYQPTSAEANEVLMAAGHPDEVVLGAPFVSLYALIAKSYMDKYGATEEDLALVAVKNHENGLRNPLAAMRRKITVEDVLKSPYISWPLKLYDSSLISDGAAGFIVSREPRKFTDTPVYVESVSLVHDTPGVFERPDITELRAMKYAAEEVFRASGLGISDIDVLEIHDAFTISELIAYEMLGLARRGEGAKILREGVTAFTGEKPVNPSGGLKSKGHPIGATGVGMVVELYWQLRGETGDRQIKDAERGLMENHGGTGGTVVVAVFSR